MLLKSNLIDNYICYANKVFDNKKGDNYLKNVHDV